MMESKSESLSGRYTRHSADKNDQSVKFLFLKRWWRCHLLFVFLRCSSLSSAPRRWCFTVATISLCWRASCVCFCSHLLASWRLKGQTRCLLFPLRVPQALLPYSRRFGSKLVLRAKQSLTPVSCFCSQNLIVIIFVCVCVCVCYHHQSGNNNTNWQGSRGRHGWFAGTKQRRIIVHPGQSAKIAQLFDS